MSDSGQVKHGSRHLLRPLQRRNGLPSSSVHRGSGVRASVNAGASERPRLVRLPVPGKRLLKDRAGLEGKGRTYIGADPDVLVVEDVARVLRCTVDTARRIPRDQLPAYSGPGRHRLYLRDDLMTYVRALRQPTPNATLILAGAAAKVLGLPADRVKRERR